MAIPRWRCNFSLLAIVTAEGSNIWGGGGGHNSNRLSILVSILLLIYSVKYCEGGPVNPSSDGPASYCWLVTRPKNDMMDPFASIIGLGRKKAQ